MSITAPFTGVIIAKNIDIGELATPGTHLFTIGDTSRKIIKTEVSVEQQKYLSVGDDVSLYFRDQKFIGKIASLSAGPDPQTHLYKVEISLPSIHPIVDLGDIVDVVLTGAPHSTSDESGTIVLPFSALKNL
ncbi:HlyD family secretion protein [Candidatus Peribacteria bacterium]|nr:HlyD family secretion protein [Candidatus Peribacteria bacterium]